MKNNPTSPAAPPVVPPDDWAVLRRSRPEDYDGHTGFSQMTPADRLTWLDNAVLFVSQHAKPPVNDSSTGH